MRRRRCDDRLGLTKAAIPFLEAREEPRDGRSADWHVTSHRNVVAPAFTGDDLDSFFGAAHFDPQKIVRQLLAESAVNFANAVRREAAASHTPGVDPPLNGDVRGRLELQIALPGILAVITVERTLDIDRMCIVPFDQVAEIAIHRPHQIGQRVCQA